MTTTLDPSSATTWPHEVLAEAPPPAPAARTSATARTPGLVWTVITVGALCMAGSVVLAAMTGHATPASWRLLSTFVMFLIAETVMLDIRFGHNRKAFTMSETALVVGLVMVPTPWVVLIGPVAVAMAHMLAHRSPIKVAFNALSAAGGIVLARATLTAIDAPELTVQHGLALAAAALAFFAWNSLTMAGAVASSQRLPFRSVYTKGLPLCLLVWAGNVGTGLLLVALGSSRSPFLLVVPVLLALLYFVYWSYLRAMHERDVWQVLQATSRQLVRVEPADVARVVMARTPELFSAEFVELLLVSDEGADSATVFRWTAPGTTDVFEAPLHRTNPFWGRMLAEREPFEIVAAEAPAALQRDLASLSLAKCVVAPLLVQQRCLGTLRIGFRGDVRFGSREMQVLTTFANHVSGAVHNTRLFEAMRVQALNDPLTGLANRTVLLDRLEQAQRRSERSPHSVAVFFLDLDRFKVVNDSLGHDAGDQLLVAVAERISANLRPGDTAARFGGDEFVVLCDEVVGPHEALVIAQRLADSLDAPFSLRGEQVYVSASVGVAIANSAQDDPAALLRDADAAMYQAKAKGPARTELFDARMRERAVARLELESDLRRAIERNELRLDYQPNVRLSDEAVVGVEALVRWSHGVRGDISPAEFIPLAEETGAIVEIGAWVIESACRQLAAWSDEGWLPGGTSRYVSINLSPVQLAHPGLVKHVAGVLAETKVTPASVCFEVTESAVVHDVHRAREVLLRLRALGVKIALDDFGTGYSSLSHLQLLPVDVLKLDRSFIARLSPAPRDRALVAGMVDLAHALNLTVVAEGVETADQLQGLRELNCDVVQGYHYSAPASPDALELVLVAGQAIGVA
jgi:diguanylate cyclase (GGDEF)-like protein